MNFISVLCPVRSSISGRQAGKKYFLKKEKLFRFWGIALLIFGSFCSHSRADFPAKQSPSIGACVGVPVCYGYTADYYATGVFPSIDAACNAVLVQALAYQASYHSLGVEVLYPNNYNPICNLYGYTNDTNYFNANIGGSALRPVGGPIYSCPADSTLSNNGSTCACSSTALQNATRNGCYQSETVDVLRDVKSSGPRSCGFGNPIFPLRGGKKEIVDTGLSVGGQMLRLTYDSARQIAATAAAVDASKYGDAPAFGALWLSSLHRNLVVSSAGFGVKLYRGDGTVASFRYQNQGYFTDADNADRLLSISGGYRYTDATNNSIETYNDIGQLTSLEIAGRKLSFTYSSGVTATVPSSGYLMRVTDDNGRSIGFEYTLPSGGIAAADGRVSRIITPTGLAIVTAYDSHGNLTFLTWEDGKSRQFLYENSTLPWALTGVVDENNSRLSTFGYDSAGRAVATERAGGVNRYSVSYATPPQVTVNQVYDAASLTTYRYHEWQGPTGTTLLTPNGQTADLGAAIVLGAPVMTSMSQPAGSGCDASNSVSSFDAKGNLLSRDDFDHQRSCYAYDSSNRETVRVEGLASTLDCSTVTPAGASLPTGARKIATAWHPDVRLPTQATQPLQRTTGVYNGQPDPFNGNAIASCAPAAAKAPDGKPIAVLCKQVVQATTDPDGSLGLAAPIATDAVQRTSSFTYDALGRTLTSTDPLNRVTTYAYYSASTGFSDSSVPSDPSFNSVSLLLHMDGANASTTYTDNAPAPKPYIGAGAAQLSAAAPKYGTASLLLDGVNSSLSTPSDTVFDLGTIYTIEFFIKPATLTPNFGVVHRGFYTTTSNTWADLSFSIRHIGSGTVRFYFYATTNANEQFIDVPNAVAPGIWKHIAMVRNGTAGQIFIDGTSAGTISALNTPAASTQPLKVGLWDYSAGNEYFNGNLDELRITKGVARYTANFTPPTQAFASAAQVIDPNAVGHTVGDLQSVTNAAGQVTQFTLYDGAGRVRQMVDAKGVVTDMAYTPRGWLSSVTVTPPGGVARTTGYSYDAVGQMIQASLADGTSLGYTYDAAHRLVGMSDAKGNAVSYTLDGMGNRVGEQVKDPQGNLQRNITRVYDALNRVQQVTGAAQ
jgi:YD repeat-containing protein